ncbi:MAG: hypothetical protein ABJH68_16535 [Ilumatobacter sp.]|uniref:hypothetical protein n=1 Tax=Ilumatobacter sp. TaxID=1967498 RepID=UPI003296C4C2
MSATTLPAINPPYSRTAVGAHVLGVLAEPEAQLVEVTDALVGDGVRLADISVFGRWAALRSFNARVDPTYRPQASRIVHLFDVTDHELGRYKRALTANEAVISVRVDTFERHRVSRLLRAHGVSDIAFYSRRHHRLPLEDFGTRGNMAQPRLGRW